MTELPDLARHQVAECGERIRRNWTGPALTEVQWDVIDEAVTLATDAAVAVGYQYALAGAGLALSRIMRGRRRTATYTCASCAQAFEGHARGPVDGPRYCSTKCRSRASNARRRAKAATQSPPKLPPPPP